MSAAGVTHLSLALVNVATACQLLSVTENKPIATIRLELGQDCGPNLINENIITLFN